MKKNYLRFKDKISLRSNSSLLVNKNGYDLELVVLAIVRITSGEIVATSN